ncbi:MAG TPA: transcriptional regulator [Bacteroidia bacterium]|nr:transcriptional regulator [Bacteroidia bacterium]
MEFKKAKQNFIQTWGALGSEWGINRTMAQIHALLLISHEPLTADQIMDELDTSRGNTNINLRTLADWGLIKKTHRLGDRKEYFEALKDIHKVAILILKERRKRELAPLIQHLQEFKNVAVNKHSPEEKAFTETVNNIEKFTQKVDRIFDKAIKAEESLLWGTLMKFLK